MRIFYKKGDAHVTNQQEGKQMKKTVEIYDKISIYLTEEELLTPAERVRFLELIENGAYY